LEERDVGTWYERSFLTGWIEGEKCGPDSLFVKLAEHMMKNNIVRFYKIDAKSVIYFLHRSQINAQIHEDASMLFLIATLNS